MNDSYHAFHIALLKQTYNQLLTHPPFNQAELQTEDEDFLLHFKQLISDLEAHQADSYDQGQALICRWIRAYPDLVPLLPRDLLWFFGGDCLHYMPDDELAAFQRLDERRYAAEALGETFDYPRERAVILGLAH